MEDGHKRINCVPVLVPFSPQQNKLYFIEKEQIFFSSVWEFKKKYVFFFTFWLDVCEILMTNSSDTWWFGIAQRLLFCLPEI